MIFNLIGVPFFKAGNIDSYLSGEESGKELKSWSYSVKEVADLLGVDDYLVYELLKKNQIEQVHIWIP